MNNNSDILNKFGDDFPTGTFLSDEANVRAAFNYVTDLKETIGDTECMYLSFLTRIICEIHGAITSFHSEKDSCVKKAITGDASFYFRILTSVIQDPSLQGYIRIKSEGFWARKNLSLDG
jgi:hypothetical protein